jgi:hypothetical protein
VIEQDHRCLYSDMLVAELLSVTMLHHFFAWKIILATLVAFNNDTTIVIILPVINILYTITFALFQRQQTAISFITTIQWSNYSLSCYFANPQESTHLAFTES